MGHLAFLAGKTKYIWVLQTRQFGLKEWQHYATYYRKKDADEVSLIVCESAHVRVLKYQLVKEG